MGIRSDVFLAVKSSIQDEFKAKFETMLTENYGAKVYLHPEGTAYYADYTKWYHDIYDDLAEMYRWLDEQDEEAFIAIQACAEYPDDHEGDRGDWRDNPWGAERYYRVGIDFNAEAK